MSDRTYRDRIEVLRSRSVRPPFSEMARLIAGTNPKTAIGFSLFPKFLSILLIVSIAGTGAYFFNAHSRSNVGSVSSDLPSRSPIGQTGTSSSLLQNTKVDGAPSRKAVASASSEHRSEERNVEESSGTVPTSPFIDTTIQQAIPDCNIPESILSFHPKDNQHEPIAISTSDKPDERNFFAVVGGAISQQFSSNSAFRQASFSDAFLGAGYWFTPNSSIRVLGGEEVFTLPGNTTIKTITFKDTTIINDSVRYQNVLGEIQSTTVPGSVRTYWLGTSYRYTMATTGLEPYAEILAGAAVQGGIGGVSVGISAFQSYPVTLDAGAFFHALFPVGGQMLTKFGANVELEYAF